MLELINGFVGELRNAGIPVSLTENLDAFEAIKFIPIEDREAFKFALAATMVKNASHWRAFETVFEVYFSLRGPQYQLKDDDQVDELMREMQNQMREGDGKGQAGGAMDSLTPEELMQLLYNALMQGDEALMKALAKQAVQRFAGMEPGRPVGGTYYLYRTLRNLDHEHGYKPLVVEGTLPAEHVDALRSRGINLDLYSHRERWNDAIAVLEPVKEAPQAAGLITCAEIVLDPDLDPELAAFYASLVESEGNHYAAYLLMARAIDDGETSRRLDFYLDLDAELIRQPHDLPILH